MSQKLKRKWIRLAWADADALRAQDIPYSASLSIKAKIDDHVGDADPHTGHVKNTGAETIAGVKTFSSFPLTPIGDPAAPYEVANKQYVDGVASASDHSLLSNLGVDDHTQYLNTTRHNALDHSAIASGINHNELSFIGVDDHHNQVHALNGGDHTGDLAYTQLDSIVKLTGAGDSSTISRSNHVHTGADGSPNVSHNNIASVTANQHHSQVHSLSGGDHSGDLVWTQLDSLVDTSGGGSASMLSAAVHVHTGADGSTQVNHGNLAGVTASQHHTEFTPTQHDARDHTAIAGTISLSELGSRAHSQLTGIGADDHHDAFTQANHNALDHTTVAGTISLSELGSRNHSQLANIGANDHHAQSHTLQSHTGDLAYSQIDSIVDTSGAGGSAQISRANHVHTGGDGSTQINHGNLTGISANQHHAQVHALNSGNHTGDLAYSQLDAIVDTSGQGGSSQISRANHQHTDSDGSTKIHHHNLYGLGDDDHSQYLNTTRHAAVDHTGIPGVGGGGGGGYDVVIDRDDYASEVDAGTALRNAIQNASNHSIFFKNGNYNMGSNICTVQANQLIVGEGNRAGGSSIEFGGVGRLEVSNQGSTLMNFAVQGSGHANTWLMRVSNHYNNFHNIEVRNASHFGWYFSVSLGYTHLVNCTAWSCGSTGFRGLVIQDETSSWVGCVAYNCDSGFYKIRNLSSCAARACSGGAGFTSCECLSSCEADSNARGFDACAFMTGLRSEANSLEGYLSCRSVSASLAWANGSRGYYILNDSGCLRSYANGGLEFESTSNVSLGENCSSDPYSEP